MKTSTSYEARSPYNFNPALHKFGWKSAWINEKIYMKYSKYSEHSYNVV